MTVTNNVVILHTPKTAGSSVRWSAIKADGFQYSCQHCKYSSLPEQYKDMRKITFIRNPYDWYASRYFFDKKRFDNANSQRTQDRNDVFSDVFSDDFHKSFEETLPLYMNLTETFKDARLLDEFKNKLRHQVMNNYQCWLVSYFDNIRDIKAEDFGNKSLYCWWLDIIGVQYADKVYRVEDQYEEGMLAEFNNPNLIHKNKSGRPKTSELYSKEMYNLVYNTDIKIFSTYGYNK